MINEDDLVFLYKDERRNYLLRAKKGRLHTDKGYLDLAAMIGKQFGEAVETNMGEKFFLLKPYLHELVMKVRRQTQILYPKDIGIILISGFSDKDKIRSQIKIRERIAILSKPYCINNLIDIMNKEMAKK